MNGNLQSDEDERREIFENWLETEKYHISELESFRDVISKTLN